MSWLFGSKDEPKQEVTLSFDPQSVQDVSSFISPTLDTSRLHPLAGLDQGGLEYLTIEDETITNPASHGLIPIKDWTDELCYGTGAMYVTGLGLGGAYGVAEGLRKTADTTSARLRLNGVLNSVTKRGPFLGNSCGVLALTYNGVNTTIGYFRGEHDNWNSLAAGALSGAIFKATKGPKPMLIASGLMTGAAGTWCLVKDLLLNP